MTQFFFYFFFLGSYFFPHFEFQMQFYFRNTKTVGITSLGLEHTQLLGKTIDNIAWQKSGIIKPNSSVFTVTQPDGCDAVMKSRAAEKNVNYLLIDLYFDISCSFQIFRIFTFSFPIFCL